MWAKSLNGHNTLTLHRSTARTQGLLAFNLQCLARHSATKARHERDGGREDRTWAIGEGK